MTDVPKRTITIRRRSLIGAVSLVGLILILGLVGFLMCNAAATNYQKQRTSDLGKLQPIAKQATAVPFASLLNLTVMETAQQFGTEQTACSTIQSLSAKASKAAGAAPKLSVAFPGSAVSFLSSDYKHAHDVHASDQVIAQQRLLSAHLASLTHACHFYVTAVGYTEADAANATARAALLVNNGQDGIECADDAANCLPNSQALADKALGYTQITADKQVGAIFAKDCVYPQLSAMCKTYAGLYAAYDTALQAFYAALNPDGTFAAQSEALTVASNNFEPTECPVLQKTQPSIYKLKTDDSIDCMTFAMHYMMQKDDQAIAAASQKLLQTH